MGARENLKRILIVGPTGSGKTTVAEMLGERNSLPVVELDTLFWGPNWTRRDDFLQVSKGWVERDSWIIEGTYGAVVEPAWARADLVVWLDLPLRTALAQLIRRTFRRVFRGEEATHGNRETVRLAVFSKDGIVIWLLRTYRKKRRFFEHVAKRNPSVAVVRIRSVRERDAWLAKFVSSDPGCPGRTGA